MAEQWQPIYLSAKVFGHLSQGLYRTPAGAIKELISNSFDADAETVKIHTDFPRFDTFSCEDNGTGMSQDEFLRLMNRGIGSSYKRVASRTHSEKFDRPLVGRLGLGILALAQVCTQFELTSHYRASKTAFRATIKFPPYTRAEMDKIQKSSKPVEDEIVRGGEFQLVELDYDPKKVGLRVFTKFLRESFRRRMRGLGKYANKNSSQKTTPYKSFDSFLDAIYAPKEGGPIQSLNLLSDYDQLLFGLALSPPLPFVSKRNIATAIPSIENRQKQLNDFKFKVQIDNIDLANPVLLPSDRYGHTADQCEIVKSSTETFKLRDGPFREDCSLNRHSLSLRNSDEQYNLYEFKYASDRVAGSRLAFNGYLFQQVGRLYPRDIQGVLIRLSNVAIGKYDNSMLVYPYAEGPRYSMVSSEIFVQAGFEDALNIDRDSFNELHPHYIRVQSYLHSLLHGLIFPVTWTEEKARNQQRRDTESKKNESRFVAGFSKTTGETVRSIKRVERSSDSRDNKSAASESPVDFDPHSISIDKTHPLLAPLLRRKKNVALVEQLAVAFERANRESNASRRRELFYQLLANIFSEP